MSSATPLRYLVRTDILKQLDAADQIRDAFFNNRGTLGISFTIEPLGLTPSRRSSLINMDGQLIAYSHGASRATGLIWPNTIGTSTEGGQSSITLVNIAGGSSGLSYRGSWSMFRLLSQAHLNSATENSADLSFITSDGSSMRYLVTAEKNNNPFTRQLFGGFALPRTLLLDNVRSTPKNLATNPAPAEGKKIPRGKR